MGANDGIVSTASLILGVTASGASREAILIAGTAGLVAGAMSMAAGEYVSVSSQADTERADLDRERGELAADVESERIELEGIYIRRGLDRDLAVQVASQLMARDALAAHARDELGMSDMTAARPTQAALSSALSFTLGATLPLVMVLIAPAQGRVWLTSASSLLALATLGAIAAWTGGSGLVRSIARVMVWGAMAMAATAAIGSIFGTFA